MDTAKIPEDYLDDLCSRFIINIPAEERDDPVRLFFQIEQAYWYYLDFYRKENTKLRSCGIKEFSKHILGHIPSYSHLLQDIDDHYDAWRTYKISVPTYGAILLNEDLTKVLLVQSYFEKTSWGFPKGKVNEDEQPHTCAVREVFEETGCDISSIINPNVFLEAHVNEQIVRLYLAPGIKESTEFQPQTRCEIRRISWFNISDLPTSRKDSTALKPGAFFMVIPFVRKLRNWIENRSGVREGRSEEKAVAQSNDLKRRLRHKSIGDPTHPSCSPNERSSSAWPTPRSKRLGNTVGKKSPAKTPKNGQQLSFQPSRSLFSDDLTAHSWLRFKLDWEPLLQCFNFEKIAL